MKPTVRMLELYQLQCSLRESQREASIASLLPVVKPFNYASLSFKSVCARACAFEPVFLTADCMELGTANFFEKRLDTLLKKAERERGGDVL